MTDSITIDCGERLSIDRVEALFTEMEAAIRHGGQITLDATHVQFCDTAGLQLLLSLQTTLEQTGHEIAWLGFTDVVSETAGYLGLNNVLHLSEITKH